MKYLLGTKKGMTQVFDEDGTVHPVTVVQAGPVQVVRIKNEDTDGYHAVQIGFGTQKPARVSKAQRPNKKDGKTFRVLSEYRVQDASALEGVSVGDEITVSAFEEGSKLTVSGVSKGKGFQGVVKRHGFAGGPRTHGQKHSEREPGSIGATGPQRVFKGVRMPGRMGGKRVTVKNLTLIKIDLENSLLYIEGAVPGAPGSVLEIQES